MWVVRDERTPPPRGINNTPPHCSISDPVLCYPVGHPYRNIIVYLQLNRKHGLTKLSRITKGWTMSTPYTRIFNNS